MTLRRYGRRSSAAGLHVGASRSGIEDFVRQVPMKKTFAYTLLVLSVLAWGAIAALPFFDISIGTAAAITTALLIGGEISFFVGIALLGKEAWEKVTSVFRRDQ